MHDIFCAKRENILSIIQKCHIVRKGAGVKENLFFTFKRLRGYSDMMSSLMGEGEISHKMTLDDKVLSIK